MNPPNLGPLFAPPLRGMPTHFPPLPGAQACLELGLSSGRADARRRFERKRDMDPLGVLGVFGTCTLELRNALWRARLKTCKRHQVLNAMCIPQRKPRSTMSRSLHRAHVSAQAHVASRAILHAKMAMTRVPECEARCGSRGMCFGRDGCQRCATRRCRCRLTLKHPVQSSAEGLISESVES